MSETTFERIPDGSVLNLEQVGFMSRGSDTWPVFTDRLNKVLSDIQTAVGYIDHRLEFLENDFVVIHYKTRCRMVRGSNGSFAPRPQRSVTLEDC